MPRSLRLALPVLLGFVVTGVSAQETSPRKRTAAPALKTAQFLDSEIVKQLQNANLQPVGASSDADFLRRAYLDITGRIPTPKQATTFLDSKDPDKRSKLIDELLASTQYGEQFGRVWRDWIAPPELPSEGNGGNQPIQATQNLGKWLGQRFNDGDGWDLLVRKLLMVEGTLKEQPQGLFWSLIGDDTGKPEPAGATRTIGSLFLGVQLQCAQCHDDPFKPWKQSDFWGMAAFFRNITWRFNGRYFDYVSESLESTGKDKKPSSIKDSAPLGSITIPKEAFKNTGKIIPGKFINGATLTMRENTALRPIFAEWLTSRDNPYFARAFVNRTWAYFMGRGIVHPIDDFRDQPEAQPALLQRLTAEFVAANHDVRHLIRCITNTQAYQRSSLPAREKNAELLAAFGRMPIKVMAADVLYDSLKLAFTDPALDLRSYDAKEANRFGESSPVGSAAEEFARLFTTDEDDPTHFTHGIPQMLALINHPRLRAGGKTVEALMKANLKPAELVEALYLATLSRRPTGEEIKEATDFVGKCKEPRKGFNGVLWMLVNRSEFLLVR